MQVFIVGSPMETGKVLDRLRLNKQIIECNQILAALDGAKAWRNHPCILQYREHKDWLIHYTNCLNCIAKGMWGDAEIHSELADRIRPSFHTEEYFTQMKRRLYTKNNSHYRQWEDLGTTEVNWYFVDGEWRFYRNGKRLKSNE